MTHSLQSRVYAYQLVDYCTQDFLFHHRKISYQNVNTPNCQVLKHDIIHCHKMLFKRNTFYLYYDNMCSIENQ